MILVSEPLFEKITLCTFNFTDSLLVSPMELGECQVKKEEARLLFLCLANKLITLPMFTKEDKCQISKNFSLKSRYIQENDRNTSEMISPH